jgi:DNA-binding NarL/FixJ family response regulator
MTKPQIHVLLADDHSVLRAGLRVLLESEADMHVIGEADDGEAALLLAGQQQVDVAVIDLGMPGMGGLETIRQLQAGHPDVKIVVLSMHSGREVVVRSLEAGADGYVPKSAAHVSLLQAIRAVHAGQRYLDPSAATIVVDEMMKQQDGAQQLAQLSERELDVLTRTAQGYSRSEIGMALALSPKTVDTYRQRAMDKLDLHHRADLVQFALQNGLLDTT